MAEFRKLLTFRVNDLTPDDHVGRRGEITYKDGYLYYHNGSTPGGEVIGGGGAGGPTSWSSVTGKPAFAAVATSGSYADLTGKPTLFSGSYTDLTNTPTIPSLDGYATQAWVNSQNFGSGNGQTFDQSLNTTDDVAFNKVTVTGSQGIEDADGLRITNINVDGKVYVGSNLTQTPVSILIGGAGPRSEWAFTPDGTLTVPGTITKDDRLTLNSAGVESGYVAAVLADGNLGRVFLRTDDGTTTRTWEFDKDGNITLPNGGDIKDFAGNSVLGGSGSITHIGNTSSFLDVDTDDDIVRMQTTNTNWIADYTFNTNNGGFTSATWDGNSIVIAGPSVDVYTAVWALTNLSTITLTISGVDYNITNTGSSTPGHPQDVTLWTDTAPPAAGPNVIDNIYIVIRNGVETYIEVDGSDIRMEAGDDVRIFAQDTFELVNRSGSDPIQITVNDNNSSTTWQFKVDGNLELPSGGTIVDNAGNNLLSGSYTPADATSWAMPAPTTISEALDRLAAKLAEIAIQTNIQKP
jgi:hypothetical protein